MLDLSDNTRYDYSECLFLSLPHIHIWENLYRHRCLMELFKIVKYRVPISIYDLFVRSDRKETYIITPNPSHNFIYKSSWLWNEFRKIIGPLDFTSPISSIKNLLTKSLLSAQARHGNEWCNVNFTEF